MDINQLVGTKIKSIRLERKLTREQVARKIKVCQQTVEKYEKGLIEISISRLIQISNVLNVGILYLLPSEAHKYYIDKQIQLNKEVICKECGKFPREPNI